MPSKIKTAWTLVALMGIALLGVGCGGSSTGDGAAAPDVTVDFATFVFETFNADPDGVPREINNITFVNTEVGAEVFEPLLTP